MSDLGPIEIFRAGEYPLTNGKAVHIGTDAIDRMVENYNATKDKLRVPIVPGHSADDASPAWGYISRLKRVGDSLMAWASSVPTKVEQAIKQKLYSSCSIEAVMDFSKTSYAANLGMADITGPRLERLAILGSTLPASPIAALDTFLARPNEPHDNRLVASMPLTQDFETERRVVACQLSELRDELHLFTQTSRFSKETTTVTLEDEMSDSERLYCSQAAPTDHAARTIRERASQRLAKHRFESTLRDDAARLSASRQTAATTHAQREDAANNTLARCLLAEGAYRPPRADDTADFRARYERGMDRFASLHPEEAAFLSGAPMRETESDDKLTLALRREAERVKS
jgi:hypothetical protein